MTPSQSQRIKITQPWTESQDCRSWWRGIYTGSRHKIIRDSDIGRKWSPKPSSAIRPSGLSNQWFERFQHDNWDRANPSNWSQFDQYSRFSIVLKHLRYPPARLLPNWNYGHVRLNIMFIILTSRRNVVLAVTYTWVFHESPLYCVFNIYVCVCIWSHDWFFSWIEPYLCKPCSELSRWIGLGTPRT